MVVRWSGGGGGGLYCGGCAHNGNTIQRLKCVSKCKGETKGLGEAVAGGGFYCGGGAGNGNIIQRLEHVSGLPHPSPAALGRPHRRWAVEPGMVLITG